MSWDSLTPATWAALGWLAIGKLVSIGLVVVLSRRDRWARRRVYVAPPRPAQTRDELRCWPLLLTDPLLCLLLIVSGALRLAPANVSNTLATFGLMFIWVDLWMYASHRAMHRFDALWSWHEHHHRAVVTQPTSAMAFSCGEKLFGYTLPWLLPVALVSHVMPVTLAGIVLLYSFYFISSPLAHANTEVSGGPGVDLPLGLGHLFGSPTSHAMHHARDDGNYGFFTTILDRLFATQHGDTAALQQRARRGRGLQDPRQQLNSNMELQ